MIIRMWVVFHIPFIEVTVRYKIGNKNENGVDRKYIPGNPWKLLWVNVHSKRIQCVQKTQSLTSSLTMWCEVSPVIV